MSSKILVTGGAGYIGSHTVVTLLQVGYEVVVVDNLSNSHAFILENIKKITGKNFTFIEGSVHDIVFLKSVFEKHPDIAGIIHFAALKSVGESVNQPLLYYRNNTTGLINILEAAEGTQVKSFVFSSSCSIYGNVEKFPVNENTPLNKVESPYANTKRIGEEILEDYAKVSKLKIIALRYFNPVGAHDSALLGELPIGVPNNLFPIITQTAIGKRASMTVFGSDYDTPDGSCVRDYIHIMDLAEAHEAALKLVTDDKETKSYQVINIGSGKGETVLGIIRLFEQLTGVKLNYTLSPRRTGDIEKIYADASLAKKVLGWQARFTSAEAISSAWAWEKYLKERGL